MVIIEPAVPSARLLRLGSKPILATCSACPAKILLDSSSPREKQQRRRWLQKRHLKSEFAPLQTLSGLFRLVPFVKCWRIFLELNSEGLYRRSRKEKESRFLVFTSSQRTDGKEMHKNNKIHVQSCCFTYRTYFALLVAVFIVVA